MKDWYKTIALIRGVAGFYGEIFGATEGIISQRAFPSRNASPTDEEMGDAMKISGRRSTNIRKSAVGILLLLVSTPLNKGSC